MTKISNPFAGHPFDLVSSDSPLDRTRRDFASRVQVINVEEQRRAEQVPADIAAGRCAPTFVDRPKPQAGGSKS